MARLYELSDRYRNLEALLEDDATAVDAVMEAAISVEEEFTDKAQTIARMILDARGDALKFKEEEDRLRSRRQAIENKAQRLLEYLSEEMQAANLTKINGDTVSLTLQKNSQGSVIIDDPGKLPAKYLVPQPAKVDKTGINTAIKAGDSVPGAHVEYGTHLRIG